MRGIFVYPMQLSSDERRMRAQADRVMQAALAAVDPAAAIGRQVRRPGETMFVGQRLYRLADYDRIFVVGGGKAGSAMAAAVEDILSERVTAGLVNVKHGYTLASGGPQRIEINQAGHPTPDEHGWRGAQRMADMLTGLTERDLVLCLISGGGSALMTLPSPGITLADVQTLTEALLRSGATINEINAVRKHLSQIKGGQLARRAQPARVVALILSDVVGSPLDVIASGPTVPDTTTFADAFSVLEEYRLLDKAPRSIVERLRAGMEGREPDTPKPGDPAFDRVYNLIVGDNRVAARAAVEQARELGFHGQLLSTFVEGEAREVAKVFAALAKEVAQTGEPLPRPACLVAGGETTVTIHGQGQGGRNQELALAAALAIDGWDGVLIAALATDGTDGPTEAAGAVASGTTVARARALGLSAPAHLADNDSYHFFRALDDLIITGPTNTNVHDRSLVFVFEE